MPAAIGVAVTALVAFSATTVGGIVVNLVIGVGLSLISAALTQSSRPPLPTPSDGQTEIQQALAPRVRYYGKVRVSGTVWWLDAVTDVLYLGLAISHGRIAQYLSFHIDENEVDIDVNDKVTTSPYSANNVYLHNRLGLATETKYTQLLTAFGVDQVRGDGVATILATVQNPSSGATFQNTYHGQRPTIRATIKASVVWDPRDSTQVRTTETTWTWSDNPVLCLLNYLMSADGFGIPWERIEPNLVEWKAAADVCDEAIALKAGGTAKRYLIAGGYRLTDAPTDVVAKFCSVCDGRVWPKRDGSIGIAVGKFVPPSVTIANEQILAYTDLMLGQDPVRAVEGIRAQYMSPDHDYREHEAEPWPTGDEVLALSDARTVALDLLWVPGASQARRLMKRAYKRATATWRGTILTNLAGLRAVDERYVRVKIDELGLDDTFEVGRLTLDPVALTVEMEILSVDASIDNWDASTEEGTADASVFAYVGSYSKTGTTIDLLAEAGGVVGQVAYIFAANGTSVASTPAGYTSINSAGPTSSLALAIFRRTIAGTEAAVTVNGASGAIIVVLMSGMPNPSESDKNIEINTGTPANQVLEAISTPYAIFDFGAATSDFDDSAWLSLVDGSKVEIGDERTTVQRTGSLTAEVNVVVYPFDAVPVNPVYAIMASDKGTNGMASFLGTPGS